MSHTYFRSMLQAMFFDEVQNYLKACASDFDSIPTKHKKELDDVALNISSKTNREQPVNLVFICTHNSRRSQFGQVWAEVAAAAYGIENIKSYSAGTEETAFHPNAIAALRRAGIQISEAIGENPRFEIRFADNYESINGFSKTLNDQSLPYENFVAIMTCSDADENCPLVPGADFRASITYQDPKIADGTDREAEVYDERCKQIASEMLYMFSKVTQ